MVTLLNQLGQVPIFSSVNRWETGHGVDDCPQSEATVARELHGLRYGRYYEGWRGACTDIANAAAEADAGIAVFIDNLATLTRYLVASFLVSAGDQSFFGSNRAWTDPQAWHAEFYDQPLGAPLGPASVAGTTWRREFEHTTVELDCVARTASISNWPTPPPPPTPTPPATGQWGAPRYCTSCDSRAPPYCQPPNCRDVGSMSVSACKAACVTDPSCVFINAAPVSANTSACQLFGTCHAWQRPGCAGRAWWTTYQYGRGQG